LVAISRTKDGEELVGREHRRAAGEGREGLLGGGEVVGDIADGAEVGERLGPPVSDRPEAPAPADDVDVGGRRRHQDVRGRSDPDARDVARERPARRLVQIGQVM
jgi:hypothetical protein